MKDTMLTKVSVLIPTRCRLNRLETLLCSYDDTTLHDRQASELVFRVDEDDLDTQDFLALFKHRVIVGPRLKGYESLPVFYNELLGQATGDVLMCGNDDMVFKTDRWPTLLLTEANKYPDGIFNLGVKTHNEDHYPFCVVSRKVADVLGFVFDPKIFWGDIYLRDVMAFFGRCVMVPHVAIDHDWAGNAPDSTFLQGEQVRRASWMEHHPQAVQDAVTKLQVLWEVSV